MTAFTESPHSKLSHTRSCPEPDDGSFSVRQQLNLTNEISLIVSAHDGLIAMGLI
ncbi:Unknown protein sequence [Pseudomonas viridiflava]|uniref:Uncharacterized protein n=1 Tax=Pseudomonas syringae pv. ribicola TaxID=55398 RepID=A0A0Q0BNQ2_PSESI|nr:Unknown protein sequence [Pseudomonas syringae pv. ribicola]KPZ23962.1 Unknown protein sequence [Pseudomonas viridiflava]